MQVEEHKPSTAMPKNEHKTASGDSKAPRGGKRPGAGRKPNLAKRLLGGANRATAADVLAKIDVEAVVNDLLKNGSRQLKWQVINVLWDRVYGKPKQDVSLTGGIVHAHTRDPFLASLSMQAFKALEQSYAEITAKYALPALQDGPQNQTESRNNERHRRRV